jgi:hypothetical protein
MKIIGCRIWGSLFCVWAAYHYIKGNLDTALWLLVTAYGWWNDANHREILQKLEKFQ